MEMKAIKNKQISKKIEMEIELMLNFENLSFANFHKITRSEFRKNKPERKFVLDLMINISEKSASIFVYSNVYRAFLLSPNRPVQLHVFWRYVPD